jgi:hypothetical protein
MLRKKIRLNLSGEKVAVIISGEAAGNALGNLYESLMKSEKIHDSGMAAIEMFLTLFGEENMEKILQFCEKNPEKSVRKFARIIKRKVYPLAVRQREYEDRQGVKKYL